MLVYGLHDFKLLLVCESTCLDLSVEVLSLLDVACKYWDSFEVKPEALREEVLHTQHVSREIMLGVRVRGRGHLREVDNSNTLIVVNQEVELVEITMD